MSLTGEPKWLSESLSFTGNSEQFCGIFSFLLFTSLGI